MYAEKEIQRGRKIEPKLVKFSINLNIPPFLTVRIFFCHIIAYWVLFTRDKFVFRGFHGLKSSFIVISVLSFFSGTCTNFAHLIKLLSNLKMEAQKLHLGESFVQQLQ